VGAIESRFWANLCRALGCEQWIEAQYDDDVQEAVRADVQAALRSKTRDEWAALLGPADTCVSPVLTVAEVSEFPQFAARGAFVDAVHPAHGTFRQTGAVLAGQSLGAGPVQGRDASDTDVDALLARAGYADDEIARLCEQGAVA
jgi:crotonobetainyl-CoA:carnitine CoA-transferase CaiB-like acyl-CoA transferase